MAASAPGEGTIYSLVAAGAVIGLGKLLASDDPITLRKAFGHCIVSGGLGGAAGLILIPLPEVPIPVIFGAACAIASLGASTVTMLLQKYIGKK